MYWASRGVLLPCGEVIMLSCRIIVFSIIAGIISMTLVNCIHAKANAAAFHTWNSTEHARLEERLASQDKRLDALEATRIAERLARIEEHSATVERMQITGLLGILGLVGETIIRMVKKRGI